jgi:hypothetical protein
MAEERQVGVEDEREVAGGHRRSVACLGAERRAGTIPSDLGEVASASEPDSVRSTPTMSSRRATRTGGALLLAAAALVAFALWRELRGDPPQLTSRGAPEAPAASAASEGAEATDVAASRERSEAPAPPWSELDALEGEEEPAREEGPRPVLLHVVDAASGGELCGVELAYASEGMATRSRASAESKRAGRPFLRGDSPLELKPAADELDVALLMVSAPGHVPSSLYLHWPSGGERRVALQASGALVVDVAGRPRGGVAQLALFDLAQDLARRRAFAELMARRAPAQPEFETELVRLMKEWRPRRVVVLEKGVATERIEGLAPGAWGVRLTAKESLDGIGEFEAGAAAVAMLAPGSDTRLELRWHEFARVEPVHVIGRLNVPREWPPEVEESGARNPRLLVRFFAPGEPRSAFHAACVRDPVASGAAGSGEVWTFDESRLTAGRWIAHFYRWNYAAAFDVPARGGSEIVFDLPPPAVLSVKVVDESGAALDDARAHCIVGPLDDADAEFEASKTEEQPLLSEWRVPQGRVLVRAESRSKEWYGSETIDLRAAQHEHVLRLRRPARIRLTLVDSSGVVIPWEDEFEPVFEQSGRRAELLDFDSPSLDPSVSLLVLGDGPGLVRVEGLSAGSMSTDSVPVLLRPGVETSVTVRVP